MSDDLATVKERAVREVAETERARTLCWEADIKAAHAAQLVALRDTAAERCAEAARRAHKIGDGNGYRVAATLEMEIAALPLPDAEAALADAVRDTRIDTVRWCHANPVESSQAHEVESADQYVARALSALGGKP